MKQSLIGAYFAFAMVCSIFMWLFGEYSYKGYMYNLGRAIVWPVNIFKSYPEIDGETPLTFASSYVDVIRSNEDSSGLGYGYFMESFGLISYYYYVKGDPSIRMKDFKNLMSRRSNANKFFSSLRNNESIMSELAEHLDGMSFGDIIRERDDLIDLLEERGEADDNEPVFSISENNRLKNKKNGVSGRSINIETSSYDDIYDDISLCKGISKIFGESLDRTIVNIGKPISIQEKIVNNQFTPNVKDKKIKLEYPNNSYVKYYYLSSSNRYLVEEIRMTFYNFTNEIAKLIPENITLMIKKNNNPHEVNLNSIRYYCTSEGNEWVDISYDTSYKISGFEFFGYTG